MTSEHKGILDWRIDGHRGLDLIGYENDSPVAKVSSRSLGYWTFEFSNYDGSGRVRIGPGCDYNPLQLVEAMFTHVVQGTDAPQGRVTTESDADFDIDFRSDWE